MNILLIHNTYQLPGGEDAVVATESLLLREAGHQVTTLVFSNHQLRTFWDRLKAGLFVLYNPWSARKVAAAIRASRPDVVHVHNFFPLCSPAVFYVAQRLGVPVCLTLHNFRLLCPSATLFFDGKPFLSSIHQAFPWQAVFRKVYRQSFWQTAAVALMSRVHTWLGTWHRRVDRYFVPTAFVRDLFASAYLALPEAKMVLKPNAGPGPVAGLPSGERGDFYLYAGLLAPWKGTELLLALARQTAWPLVIAGTGPEEAAFQQLAAACPQVTCVGQRTLEEVQTLMRQCRALLIPSVCYENMPMVLLEAWAQGTPVLASNRGSLDELIRDGQNGLLFNPDTPVGLIRCLERAEAQPGLLAAIGKGGWETFQQQFTPGHVLQKLIDTYTNVLCVAEGKV